MSPATEPANPWRANARARKVSAVVEVIDRESLARGINPHRHARAVLDMLDACTADTWIALASAAGVRPLSETSRDAVRSVYERRARDRYCARGHRSCYSARCGGTE